MRGVEIRGLLAFAAVVAAIAVLWTRIDAQDVSKAYGFGTTTTTLTILVESTTTTTPEQAIGAVCDAAQTLTAEIEALDQESDTSEGGGDETEEDAEEEGLDIVLTAEFWAEALPFLPAEVHTEATAVVDYYEGYLEVTEPFDHDPVRIIIEGDKERYEQLLTRPVPGLDVSRDFVAFVCGVEIPDKPSMSSGAFADLEERLLDSDPLQR